MLPAILQVLRTNADGRLHTVSTLFGAFATKHCESGPLESVFTILTFMKLSHWTMGDVSNSFLKQFYAQDVVKKNRLDIFE